MNIPSQATKTILIIDDERGIRSALADLLEDEGYKVATVGSGREALDYLHHNPDSPSLILLDLLMPEMSGIEFRIHQQKEPRLAEIPVVVMSANLLLAQATDVLGVAEYLQKPFDMDILMSAVIRHCGYGSQQW